MVENHLAVQDTGLGGWGVILWGRSLGEGNDPLQYSCLENLMDRGA